MTADLEPGARTLLRWTASDVEPSADLLSTVRRGARRRRHRHVALGGVAAVVALIVAAVVTTVGLRVPPPPARPATPPSGLFGRELLLRHTAGNRAHDTRFLNEAVEAWKPYHPQGEDSKSGPPNVVWAGDTKAGRATAYLAQLMHDRKGRFPPYLVVGLVDTDTDGTVRVVASGEARGPNFVNSYPILFGPHGSTLVLPDLGIPLYYSTARSYDANGVHRTWTPASFTGGVAFLPVPPQHDPSAVKVSTSPTPSPDTQVRVVTDKGLGPWADHRLPWMEKSGTVFLPWLRPLTTGADLAWHENRPNGEDPVYATFLAAMSTGHYNESAIDGSTGNDSTWYLYGALANGATFVAAELQLGSDPSHTYLVYRLGAQTRVITALTDHTFALPVCIRLPDHQGLLVAAKGHTLKSSTDAIHWQPADRDAALLPANTSAVMVDNTLVLVG